MPEIETFLKVALHLCHRCVDADLWLENLLDFTSLALRCVQHLRSHWHAAD